MNGDVSELLDALRIESERHRKRSRAFRWIIGVTFTVALVTWLAIALLTGRGTPDLVLPLPILMVAAIAAANYSPRYKSLVAEAAARKDLGVVTHLITAAHAREEEVRTLAENALPELLGLWLSRSGHSLEPEERGLLYRLLEPERPIELVEAVLIVIRSEGGPEALPYLESLQAKVQPHQIARWQRLSGKTSEVMADVRLREAKRIIEAGPVRDDVLGTPVEGQTMLDPRS